VVAILAASCCHRMSGDNSNCIVICQKNFSTAARVDGDDISGSQRVEMTSAKALCCKKQSTDSLGSIMMH